MLRVLCLANLLCIGAFNIALFLPASAEPSHEHRNLASDFTRQFKEQGYEVVLDLGRGRIDLDRVDLLYSHNWDERLDLSIRFMRQEIGQFEPTPAGKRSWKSHVEPIVTNMTKGAKDWEIALRGHPRTRTGAATQQQLRQRMAELAQVQQDANLYFAGGEAGVLLAVQQAPDYWTALDHVTAAYGSEHRAGAAVSQALELRWQETRAAEERRMAVAAAAQKAQEEHLAAEYARNQPRWEAMASRLKLPGLFYNVWLGDLDRATAATGAGTLNNKINDFYQMIDLPVNFGSVFSQTQAIYHLQALEIACPGTIARVAGDWQPPFNLRLTFDAQGKVQSSGEGYYVQRSDGGADYIKSNSERFRDSGGGASVDDAYTIADGLGCSHLGHYTHNLMAFINDDSIYNAADNPLIMMTPLLKGVFANE